MDSFFDALQVEQERHDSFLYGLGKTSRVPCVPFLFRVTQSAGKRDEKS